MDTNALDTFCGALNAEANKRFGDNPLTLALVKGAIEAYARAYRAYLKTVGDTITSYSINGRSVTKATADSSAWREAYRRLLGFFPDLPPETSTGASLASVDFSGVPLS